MFPDLSQYLKDKYGNLPEIDVTEQEFQDLLIRSGRTAEQAARQVAFAKAFRGRAMIGDCMVGVKGDES